MTDVALCQCVRCKRYLAENRTTSGVQYCIECVAEHRRMASCCCDARGWTGPCPACAPAVGLRLAMINTLQDLLSIELLALIGEECAEVIQRKEKITRWGWDADFEGTTQRHKFEVELGDVVANAVLADCNGLVSLERVLQRAEEKMEKYREDRRGPQQRLLHTSPPMVHSVPMLVLKAAMRAMTDDERREVRDWIATVG